ncbi:MAG TPA: long-chain fatty acid--CoA ligase [Alphaproteobacteria bacterium]|nr:long-chain fatty acid--CoA ligase [Alphaproteobacteria bacterium]
MASEKATTSSEPSGEKQPAKAKPAKPAGAVKHPWVKSYPPGLKWDTEIPERRLYALMDHAVERFAKNDAVDFLGKTMTYGDIGDHVDRMAKGLQAMGVHAGVKVGLFLPNTPYGVIGFFAILKAGGTVVNYNPLYAERELLYQIDNSETDYLVTLDLKVLYDKIPALLKQSRLKKVIICRMQDILPFPKNLLFPLVKGKEIAKFPRDDQHVRYNDLIKNDGRVDEPRIDPAKDIAVLQYTGGTTGVPKGAMLTHANLYANAMQCDMWFPSEEGKAERLIGVLPLFHVFAMTIVMTYGVYKGSCMILLPRFEIDQLLSTIQRAKPTIMPGVPTIFTAINNYPKLGEYDLSSLAYCLSGGAALPLEVKQKFERLTGCTLVEGYGLSETSPVATANPFAGVNKESSIGLPVPGTTIEIISIESGKPVPLGENGEICISGPQVMAGYWNNPEATKDSIVDGRFRSGDIGYMDKDGYTFIVDRLKEMILAGGYNVYPRNVEEAIYMHPAVAECAVVGIPDEYRGQTVKAYVALAEGQSLTEADLIAFLQDKISKIEMPKMVEFRTELPKSAIGKILKKELLAEEAAKAEG